MNHLPVLLKEIIDFLAPKKGQVFIDCTLDGGGHSEAILEKIGKRGKLLGIDIDPSAIEYSQKRLVHFGDRIVFARGNFKNLKEIALRYGFRKVSGILFDLGLSSLQLEDKTRGFSFSFDAPLDMRMGEREKDASYLVNNLSEGELARIFKEYGEERFAQRIARRITEERKKTPILRTFKLVEIIKKAIPPKVRWGRIHPATRVFQALRIATNSELENLHLALPRAIELLAPQGKIVVISFHSGEDRIVKNFFKEKGKEGKIKILTKKPIRSSFEEILKNPRSRSAKLRAASKL